MFLSNLDKPDWQTLILFVVIYVWPLIGKVKKYPKIVMNVSASSVILNFWKEMRN